jgi:hypothetical protein
MGEYLTEREIERLMDAARGNRWGHRDAMAVETLGEAFDHGWRITARCAWGKRDAMKSRRECVYIRDLDLETLIWTRGARVPAFVARKPPKMPPMRLKARDRPPSAAQQHGGSARAVTASSGKDSSLLLLRQPDQCGFSNAPSCTCVSNTRRSASRCHWSRFSRRCSTRTTYARSNSFALRASASIARRCSTSMRNSVISRRITGTGSDASGGWCAGNLRMK